MNHIVSEETKIKLSLALKGKVRSEQHCHNISKSLKGKHHSEDHKRKVSLARRGKKHSEETKQKISLALKGKVNVGKTPWMKGKHHTEETKRKLSKIHKGKHYSPQNEFKKGHQWPKEILEKIGSKLKNRKISQEQINKMKISRLNQVLPQKDTSIEVKMQNELRSRGIRFEKHLPICNICQPDIIFPNKNVAIFCDGDYWHSKSFNNGKRWENDRLQDERLRENGWIVYRFWEHEINNNVSACVDEIMGGIKC